MNEQLTLDDPLNAYGCQVPISYNPYVSSNDNYFGYNVKHEPNCAPLANNSQQTYSNVSLPNLPESTKHPLETLSHKALPITNDSTNSTSQSLTEDIKPKTKKSKAKGRTSSYWNAKIEDKDFKFYGCSICHTSFKDLIDLDAHITTDHSNERLSSYDFRKINKLKNKGRKKAKKKGKKIKVEKDIEFEIKPEDGYIGSEKATEYTAVDGVNLPQTTISKEAGDDNGKKDATGNESDSNDKIMKIYKCFGCNKSFAMSYYLRLHVRSHTGEKPYACKVCGETFITASKRGRHHKRVHLAVRHQCRICFRQFSRFELLTKHFDKRHLEDKLEGEVYDYFAILPYMKELEEELRLKLSESKPKTDDLWPDDPPKPEPKDEVEVKVKVEENDETNYPETVPIEGILVEEVKVDFSDDEVKVKTEVNDDDDRGADDATKDERDSFSDEDYFPSNTWATSPKMEPEETPPKKKKQYTRNADGSQTCEYCSKVIKTASYMIIHMRTHTGEKPYTCYVCHKGFITASKLNRHVLTHTEEERNVPADGENAEIKIEYQKPRKKGRPKTTNTVKKHRKRQYSCEYCSQTFFFKDTLEVHLKSHQGEDLVYKCKYCLEVMESKEVMIEHEKTHDGPKPFLCTVCGRQYPKKESLVYHRKGHDMPNNFACDICSKTFKAKCQLKRHLAAHTHTKYILRYECPVCAHMFNTKYHIQMHLHTHQKEGLIVEENRNEILAMVLQNARKIPKSTDTPVTPLAAPPDDDRSRICNICGEIFTHFYYLEEHLKSHGSKITLLDDEKEEDKKYICPVCNKGFKLHYYLKLHSFTHTKERPYICQQCGKGFITKGKLKRHIETHSGWKKYQCHVCCKFFTRPSYLRIHIRTIHGTQDYNFRFLDKVYGNDSASSVTGSMCSINH